MAQANHKTIGSSNQMIITFPQMVAFIASIISGMFVIAMDFKEDVRHTDMQHQENLRALLNLNQKELNTLIETLKTIKNISKS